jgi:methionyl-tRNA synthetase
MHRFYDFLNERPSRARPFFERQNFSPQRLTRFLLELVQSARYFGRSQDYWKSIAAARPLRHTAIALELAAARMLALLAAPLMPDFAASLWSSLGQVTSLQNSSWSDKAEWLIPGTPITDLRRSYFVRHENTELLPDSIGTVA